MCPKGKFMLAQYSESKLQESCLEFTENVTSHNEWDKTSSRELPHVPWEAGSGWSLSILP